MSIIATGGISGSGDLVVVNNSPTAEQRRNSGSSGGTLHQTSLAAGNSSSNNCDRKNNFWSDDDHDEKVSQGRERDHLIVPPVDHSLHSVNKNRMGDNNNIVTDFVKVDTRWGCFGVGEKVFAYWKGRTSYSTGYYSGTIVKKGVLNTYNIHFDDDTVSNTSEVQILPISVLGTDTKVFYLPDEFSKGPMAAMVVGQKFPENESSSENDVQYAIQCFGSTNVILCDRRHLYLGSAQAKDLRRKYDAVQPKFGDVNLDNVVSGPRRRGRISESASSESISNSNTSPPTSTTKETNQKSKKQTANSISRKPSKRKSVPTVGSDTTDSADDEPMPKLQPVPVSHEDTKSSIDALTYSSSAISKKGANEKVQKEKSTAAGENPNTQQELIQKPNPESQPQGSSLIGRLMNNLKKKSNNASKPKDVTTTKKVLQEGNLFEGYNFFLTSGDRELIKGIGGDICKEVSKTEMQKMILRQGGTELLSVGDEKGKPEDRVFLLASSHLRTLKYLYCIARGIPCIAQRWIQDCLTKNEIIDWSIYRLSAGWSIESKQLIPIHNKFPLENMKIGLATFRTETIDTWKKLIPAAKGSVTISKDFHYDRQPAELKVPNDWLVDGKIDILVSDYYCPAATLDLLKAKNIPLVRIEWLVQSIISGKKADYKVGETTTNSVCGESLPQLSSQ